MSALGRYRELPQGRSGLFGCDIRIVRQRGGDPVQGALPAPERLGAWSVRQSPADDGVVPGDECLFHVSSDADVRDVLDPRRPTDAFLLVRHEGILAALRRRVKGTRES